MNKKGFTLIELLVVVLIIGILVAIAVPQYQYAVLRTRYMRMVTLAESFKSAQERYFLANGKYASSLMDLDISVNGELSTEPLGNTEAIKIDDFYIFTSATQLATYWVDKEDNLYMMYNLRYDNINNVNMWDGAHALCRAYDTSGEAGAKVCKSFPTSRDCERNDSKKYYACRIF